MPVFYDDLSHVVSDCIPEYSKPDAINVPSPVFATIQSEGIGELSLANVLPVELEEAREEEEISNEAPCRVQWKLTCANPAVGEKLVLDLFAREPRVLGEPAPRVEAQGHSLRIGYHVHPGLPAAERTQIAVRLTEVLQGVPPASSLSGGSVR